ncbi:MAG: YihY/virulence factor BrkB family protein [Bacteroidia bacterium]
MKIFHHFQRKVDRLLQHVYIVLRKVHLPGFRGMNLYEVLRFFYNGLTDTKFTLMAAAMAYNFFLALFPAIILTFFSLSFTPVPEIVEDEIMHFLQSVIPNSESALSEVQDIVTNMLTTQDSTGTTITGIVFFGFLTLWWAMRGVTAMIRAFSKEEEVFRQRNVFQTYWTSAVVLFLLGGIFLLAISLQIAGQLSINYLQEAGWIGKGLVGFLLNTLNYSISLCLLLFSISSVYYLGPATHQRWKFFSPGAFVASLLTVATIAGFSWFFSNIDKYNAVYGSLAAIILLLLWFYYISIVLLIGFELNAAIDMASFHSVSQAENYTTPNKTVPPLDSPDSVDILPEPPPPEPFQ